MTTLEAAMTRDEAERITERINIALNRVSNAWEDLAERISEAYQRRADLALGYGSWQEYAAAELRPAEGIAADVRRKLVGMLTAEGMSTRAIAPTVGVSNYTVHSDQRAAVSEPNTSPESDPADGSVDRIDPHTGEILDHDRTPAFIDPPEPAPKVTGIDGKTYTRPTPKTTPRAALPPQVQSAGWNLYKAVERIQKLAEDDRFNTHKKEMAPHLRSHLTSAIEVCQDLLDRIN